MSAIGLAEVVSELRRELQVAADAAEGEELLFEATALEVEFQVGVTKQADGKGGVKFWVLELGGGASVSSSNTQKITLSFTPRRRDGSSVKIAKCANKSPLSAGPGNH